MDEPTAALSATEVARLFEVVRTLRAAGAAVLFISHRLEEVFAICQRVTVMRDGSHVFTKELAGLTADDLVRAMVGREMVQREAGERGTPGDGVLQVQRLTREGVFTDISLEVRAGEIVALAGLVGSGRSEVARAIFGIDRYDAGTVLMSGRELRRASPGRRWRPEWASSPRTGGSKGWSWTCPCSRTWPSRRWPGSGGPVWSGPRPSARSPLTGRCGCKLKYGKLTDPVSRLSGGNQQKVVLAKWLGRKPTLLIVDEPTRGIDIATKAEVHQLLVQLARDGVAVLMISSELPEVLRIGDRILVMREGRLTAEFGHADVSEEKIMAAATGQLHQQAL